jgi:ArsR family transcriptional regulator, lead/cadmium/zinc/bismuth-responsive transcriptional repressor
VDNLYAPVDNIRFYPHFIQLTDPYINCKLQYMSTYSYVDEVTAAEGQSAECEINIIHEDRVAQARSSMLKDAAAAGLAEVFQALADPTRIKLISALLTNEMCVCDLAATLGLSQSAVSHQLKLLRTLRVVKFRKEGRVVYYTLDDDHIRLLYQMGLEHFLHRNAR